MIRFLYRSVAVLLALFISASLAFGQVSFNGYVPHADEVPAPKARNHGDTGNWYNGEEFVPRVLTLEFGHKTNEFFPPASTLIVPGSGTIPNSEFLRGALGVMGFEAPASPYVLLDDLTHKTVELYAYSDVIGFLEAQSDGSIFIVGLDFHSGFIRKDSDGLTFIHAGEDNTGSLVREPLEDALTLKDNQIFVIGDLSERARIVLGVDAI